MLLTCGLAAVGSLLAWFYDEPRVENVAVGISFTILLTSTSVVHMALLQRAMRFPVVSAIGIFSRFLSVLLSILFSWAGWGYWALVLGAITVPLVGTIGSWAVCQWIPGRPKRVAGTGTMLRFALNVYAWFTVNYSSRNLDNVLIGWRFSPQALGFYKKAYDLFALSMAQLIAPLTKVAVAALSRLNGEPEQYKRYLLVTLGLVAFAGMGIGAGLTLVGKDLILLLLGPGWELSGTIFMLFGPGIGIMLVYGTHGWIHLSLGKPDRWLRWGLVEFAVTALLFLLALPWGPIGLAAAWTISFWTLTIPALWYAGRPINLAIGSVIDVVWRYVVASLIAGGASAMIVGEIPSFSGTSDPVDTFTRIVLTSLLFGILYVLAVILLHRSCQSLYQVARLLRAMIPSSRPTASPTTPATQSADNS